MAQLLHLCEGVVIIMWVASQVLLRLEPMKVVKITTVHKWSYKKVMKKHLTEMNHKAH